jgi:hypothetical protein
LFAAVFALQFSLRAIEISVAFHKSFEDKQFAIEHDRLCSLRLQEDH